MSIAMRLVSIMLLGSLATAAAEPQPNVRFDIPAQSLESALMSFSRQAGMQLVVADSIIKGLKTPGIRGEYSASDALDLLLQGSGLSYRVTDERTIAISAAKPKRVTQEISTMHLARADGEEDERKASEDGKTSTGEKDGSAPEVVVTGSRIRSLLGEQSMQPVLTITREDIDRYGVSSLGELLRYIPQVSSSEIGQMTHSLLGTANMTTTANRITASLRGAPISGTLLLVNGRRVAKSGQSGGGNDGYDLSGVPLSAIERIDVLLDGASAVYGADAVGGVINVILKRNYQGTEARAGYENTFDTDVGVKTLALTHGFSFGKLSGLVSASWERANSLGWADRDFLSTFDRRRFGGPDARSSAVFGFDGRGQISSVSGNLPGLGTNRASIPAGSTGVNLTVANFASAGPLPGVFDPGKYLRYSAPYERQAVTGNVEYTFAPALTAFAEARWGEGHTWISTTPLSANSTVPAGAPGNPFGVAIRVTKYFFDLPAPEQELVTANSAATVGLRGEFLKDWRYEVAANEARSHPGLERQLGVFNATQLAAAFAGPNPPILIYDSTGDLSPNPSGLLLGMTQSATSTERSGMRSYDVQADGPLFSLPAGPVRVSVGAEYRDEQVDFESVGIAAAEFGLSVQSNQRHTTGYFAEMRIPLVAPQQGWPLLERLEASIAARHDRYSDFPEATNPRYGLLYRPVSWLMLRASRGEGYKVPTLAQLYQPLVQAGGAITPGSVVDALRGNEVVVAPTGGLAVTTQGNPDLRPERSKNTTAGAVLELPFLEGFSLSVDYFDTRYVDRVGNIALTDRIILFPDTVIRGPNRPGDLAGWPGPVIGYRNIAFNIAVNRVSGYDFGMKYHRVIGPGEWTLQGIASKATRNEFRSAPDLPLTTASTTLTLPLQVSGSLFWARDAFRTGVLGTYRAENGGTTVSAAAVPSAIRWDWQVGYDFANRNLPNTLLGKALAGTRVSLTVFNMFDVLPPLRGTTTFPDNTVVDSRLRRYGLNFTRSF